jgi:hypothetical protein
MPNQKSAEALPNTLRGAVVAQYRKRGDRTYGPYWFRVWREKGKVRKVYVKPEELEAVRRACERRRELKHLAAYAKHLVRNSSATLRAVSHAVDRASEGKRLSKIVKRKGDDLTTLQLRRLERFLKGAGNE